jgi:hypothetical protein
MHFSILFLAAGCDSKWAPIRCSSIFEIAGLIGKVLAPMPAFPGDEPYGGSACSRWRLSKPRAAPLSLPLFQGTGPNCTLAGAL